MGEQILSSRLADILTTKILDGTYKPGDKFPTERELADELCASRTSVREAIKLLVARNILTIRRGVGTFVNEMPGIDSDPLGVYSQEDILTVLEDWYTVRLTLEGEAMQFIAARASDEEIANICKIMNDELSKATVYDTNFFADDQAFHCALARATHNIILERLIPSLHASVYYDMMRSISGHLYSRFYKNISDNHSNITRQLERRDGIGAKVAMEYHMLVAIEDVRSLKQKKENLKL